jgi:hypothetical protein
MIFEITGGVKKKMRPPFGHWRESFFPYRPLVPVSVIGPAAPVFLSLASSGHPVRLTALRRRPPLLLKPVVVLNSTGTSSATQHWRRGAGWPAEMAPSLTATNILRVIPT